MRNRRYIFVLAVFLLVISFGLDVFLPQPANILKKGRRHFDGGQFQAARKEFQEAANLSKKSSGVRCEAHIFYATCFVRENELAKGSRELSTFVKLYPTSFWTPQAYFDLAYCESMLGRKEEAKRIYKMIIVDFSTTSWAKYSKERLDEFKDS